MRLVVFGATGGIGLEVVRQGLDLRHEITAVVRSASRLPAELHARVDVVEADVMDPDAITPAVKGRDAVITAIGPRGRGPTTVHSASIASIIEAMRRTGVRRLLTVGASGMVADAGDGLLTRYVLKPLVVQRVFGQSYADLAASEELVRASDLDWTIVRPSRLTNAGRTNRYRTARDLNVRGGMSTTRADVADCMLGLIGDPTSARHVISVAS
ncbi:putative NADH-flavin reductase [Nonomuraea polychroma]|uniref:Putative NADH-flavin reductase n=1 Tax=Nonomuraea polychroma TaxID=46176 RepID=A0A438M586_9ACTN|nr:SDR family oxidoreductase [Nonomuraea polychroma]RVX40821.1 putative NADH-flavin reductase [Nonomuraea polychroma]